MNNLSMDQITPVYSISFVVDKYKIIRQTSPFLLPQWIFLWKMSGFSTLWFSSILPWFKMEKGVDLFGRKKYHHFNISLMQFQMIIFRIAVFLWIRVREVIDYEVSHEGGYILKVTAFVCCGRKQVPQSAGNGSNDKGNRKADFQSEVICGLDHFSAISCCWRSSSGHQLHFWTNIWRYGKCIITSKQSFAQTHCQERFKSFATKISDGSLRSRNWLRNDYIGITHADLIQYEKRSTIDYQGWSWEVPQLSILLMSWMKTSEDWIKISSYHCGCIPSASIMVPG